MNLKIPDIPCSIVWNYVNLFTRNSNNNHREHPFLGRQENEIKIASTSKQSPHIELNVTFYSRFPVPHHHCG
jgi:hypothetical protein